ncbi:MAG: carbonic anhydrase family protein [Hyphomicrobiales bacterium]|nr:carbonic anhydrase family protein [Hyphomicrobiales bacterium]
MSRDPITCFQPAALFALSLLTFAGAAPAAGQIAQPPERAEQHRHDHSMDMNLPSGVTDKCGPTYTYDEGPRGPSRWAGVCATGHMQTPIDISNPEKIPHELLPQPQFSYQPAELDMVNDCNNYQLKLRFSPNHWLKVGKKPYRLSEVRFREPGENAVNGQRPPMSLELVHLSPEANFLVVEVPVAVGKENPIIKTLWQHIPYWGQEVKVADIKINVMDLLPADRRFYRFPGSLTAPICNEPVQWYLMKSPIEMSEAQIEQYRKYYHNTARPLQPLNNRPLVESQ